MTVRSQDIYGSSGADVTRKRRTVQRSVRWGNVPYIIAGYIIVIFFWLIGARYTIDGAPLAANWILKFIRAPVQLTPIASYEWYLYLVWLPVLYSYVENRKRPIRWVRENGVKVVKFAPIAFCIVWLFVSSTDGISTYLATTNPPSDAWYISKQVAQTPIIAGIWTAILTFGPEVLALALTWMLWREDG
jgi:hypothetical protein